MAQYRDLNAPPRQTFADIVAEMRDQAKSSKTGSAGVKDLGEYGDVVWSRPDGAPVSVRDVDLELGDARQRIEDAEADVLAAQARINIALDAEGHIREDEILRNATLIGDTVVDNINVVGKLVGTDGVFTGTVDFENINVTDEVLAARISGEHIYGTVIEGGLFKTSDALPGQVEIADDAYVTHLDGGGTFPGVRIIPLSTAGMNLPPAIGPSTNGVTIFGGRSVGGGSSTIQASPTVSSMTAYRDAGGMGSRIGATSTGASLVAYYDDGRPSGEIDASRFGASLRTWREGGKSGGTMGTHPTESYMTTYREDETRGSEIRNTPSSSTMRTYSGNADESGWMRTRPQDAELAYLAADYTYFSRIKADASEAFLYTKAGGARRYLTVNAKGIWAQTDESGSMQSVSLVPQVRQFQYSALWNADLSPAHIMVQHLPGGKLCQAQIRIQNLSGSSLSLPHDDWVTLNYNPIPSDLRGGFTDYIEVTLPQLNARGRVEMNYSTGRIRVKSLEKDKDGNPITIDWHNNNSIWFPMRWFSPN